MNTTRRQAGAGASVGSGAAWNNTENITASNDTRAVASLSNYSQTSQQLKASSMTVVSGDAIPAGATITAGRVIVEGHAGGSQIQWQGVAFYVGDDIVGSAAAAQIVTDIGTDGTYTFTPTASLTPEIVNDPTFNVRLVGKWNSGGFLAARVDTVYDEFDWTPPPQVGSRLARNASFGLFPLRGYPV